MNTNKPVSLKSFFLLSLTLLATVAPALGMENSSKNEIEKTGKQEVEINNKPTFGKLIDGNLLNKSQVWAAVIAFKKQLPAMIVTAGENSSELPMEIVENILFHYLLDTTIDPKIRANVALEFLADPEYKFLHSALVRLIKESDLTLNAFPLAVKLGYSKGVQQALISESVLKALITLFSDNPQPVYSLTPSLNYDAIQDLAKNFKNIGIQNGEQLETHLNLLTPEDFKTLVHHMFNLNAQKMEFDKVRDVLMKYKEVIFHSRKHKIDLNFENNQGITPLIWTTKLPLEWNNYGHLDALQKTIIFSGANMNYKNKNGLTFQDFAEPSIYERVKKYVEERDFIATNDYIPNGRFNEDFKKFLEDLYKDQDKQ